MSKPKKSLAIVTPLVVIAAALAFSGLAYQAKSAANASSATALKPIFRTAVNFAESDAVRDLPDASSTDFQSDEEDIEGHEINEQNTFELKTTTALSAKFPSVDSALPGLKAIQVQAPTAPILTFDGLLDTDNASLGTGLVAPSDENLDVGPNDVVQTVNNAFRVWDKNGNPKTAPKLISQLFSRLGGICTTRDRGDPVVLYDRMANRWFITQFNFTGLTTPPYHQCVAVSKTPDPTGSYYIYDFITPGNEFPDYGKFGVWPDGYYFTVNQFTNGGAFNGTGVYALDRNKMLVGDPNAGFIYFSLNLQTNPEGVASMQPSDFDGLQGPPLGAPNVLGYLISDEFEDPPFNKDALRLFNFHADFVTPGNSYFVERAESPLLVSAFDPRNPSGRADIKEPPPATTADYLDSIPYHLMYRLQYRNRGGTESLVSSTTVNVSGLAGTTLATYQAGVRYFELHKTSANGQYTLYDNVTFSPDSGNPTTGVNRWLPSAAIDNQGNLAVSFSASSTTLFPSIYYVGRDFNAVGTLSSEQLLFAGTASQLGSGNRWGDYQSVQVDPSDDCTFWTTNQYYSTNSSFNWRTRIGNFKFPLCTAPAQGTLKGTITACDSGLPVAGALVQLSNGFSTSTLADGSYSLQVTPSTYTVSVSDGSRNCLSSFNAPVTITNGGLITYNTCLNGTANPDLNTSDPTNTAISGGNGNGIIDANECNNLIVKLQNLGCAPARNVSAILTTSTPGVTITQPNGTYPNIAIDATQANTSPFKISTSPSLACGTTINFTLTISYTGGTKVINFSLPTCTETQPAQVASASVDPGDPTTVSGRLGRANPPSSCGSSKVCPGTLGTGPRSYDSIPFTNSGPLPACVNVNVTSTAGSQIFAAAYSALFDPANQCTGYLGDAGQSSNNMNFQVTIAPGAVFYVVLQDAAGVTNSTPYTVTVTGLSAAQVDGGGTCAPASLTTQVSSTSITLGSSIYDTATLTGSTSSSGTLTFALYGPDNNACSGTPIFTFSQIVNGDGFFSSTPYTPTATGTYRWVASYNDNVNPVVTTACGDPNETTTVSPVPTPTPTPAPTPIPPSPTLSTQTTGSSIPLGGATSDTATLSGGSNPGGTITFRLYGPNDNSCSGTPVFNNVQVVNGNGVYGTTTFTPAQPGTYHWVAMYSGDANNGTVDTACNDPLEQVIVGATPPPSPTLTTQTSALSFIIGGSTSDTATLAGGSSPGGTITFRLYGPNDNSCSSTPAFNNVQVVNGNGVYGTTAFTPAQPGTYHWVAMYSGDANNGPVDTACNDPLEQVTVSAPTPTPTPTPAAQGQNISTRAFVGTAESQEIGGFIISGGSKKVLIRGLGPTLTQSGLTATLADPVIELRGANGAFLATNDNWRDTQEAQIIATGLQPGFDVESAIVATLNAGNYTAILSGKGGTTGLGLVEVYNLDTTGSSTLSNLSTRGFVQTGDRIMIGGFILGRNAGSADVIIRGIGPSLANFGVANPLQDPTLELRNADGALIRSNDNWQDNASQAVIIITAGLAPGDNRESAIAATLPPGTYTALLSGRNGGTGIALVEVYFR